MNNQRISVLKRKLDEKIIQDNITPEELLSLSQELDVLIVEEMKEHIRSGNIQDSDESFLVKKAN